MNKKIQQTGWLLLALVITIAMAAHAERRGRPVITNPVTVNPLAGYEGQVFNDDYMAAAPLATLDMGSETLLDDPTR